MKTGEKLGEIPKVRGTKRKEKIEFAKGLLWTTCKYLPKGGFLFTSPHWDLNIQMNKSGTLIANNCTNPRVYVKHLHNL